MKEFIGRRLYEYTARHSCGVVRDARFTHCYWPRLNEPTEIFAQGSSGIIVLGSPSPRNVVFPDDTVFEEEVLDARYPAEMAVRAAYPNLTGLINLDDEQAAIWRAAYDAAVAELPPQATKHALQDEGRFAILYRENGGIFSADITPQDAWDIAAGKKKANRRKLKFVNVKTGEPQ